MLKGSFTLPIILFIFISFFTFLFYLFIILLFTVQLLIAGKDMHNLKDFLGELRALGGFISSSTKVFFYTFCCVNILVLLSESRVGPEKPHGGTEKQNLSH